MASYGVNSTRPIKKQKWNLEDQGEILGIKEKDPQLSKLTNVKNKK